MKSKKKKTTRLAPGMQPTREIPKSRVRRTPASQAYSPLETGQPDTDADGRGPTNQEGEGDRQNDQLAELENIEPEIK